MDLKDSNENPNNESRHLFLVGTPRDPLVSAGAVTTTTAEEIHLGDPQTSALVSLMGPQSSSVCFPAKFSK